MRGSREISLVPSLHRASTDALIKPFSAFDLLCPNVVGIELLVVSVSSYKSSSKLCLAVYYRPPSSGVDSFSFLSAALMSPNPTVFDNLGDCNVNYFCSGSFCTLI